MMPTTTPYWSNSMNYVFAGKVISSRNLCLSGFASIQGSAFCQQFFAGSVVNRSIYATATKKRFVRCVHNHFHRINFCDVAKNCADNSISRFHAYSPSIYKANRLWVEGPICILFQNEVKEGKTGSGIVLQNGFVLRKSNTVYFPEHVAEIPLFLVYLHNLYYSNLSS